jgi:farnesol dehydrogenase
MKVLVTGASGFIGTRLCHRLAESGDQVIAMYRNASRLKDLQHGNITPIEGCIESLESLRNAMQDCEGCFHLAALAKHWSGDPTEFQRVQVAGTSNVLTIARETGIRRVVFTSTAAVFGPAELGNPVNETHPLADQLDSEYERTKRACEPVVRRFQSAGLDVVTVYPTRVYGPGPLSTSNVLTDIFRRLVAGKWRFIPGNGRAMGNYVFIDDVVAGHVLAMLDSKANEKYLIGGENLSFNQVVEQIQTSSGVSVRTFHVPKPWLLLFANWQLIQARCLGRVPKITPPFVNKYLKNWCVDCTKAEMEIGYSPTSFQDGFETTLDWIRENAVQGNPSVRTPASPSSR